MSVAVEFGAGGAVLRAGGRRHLRLVLPGEVPPVEVEPVPAPAGPVRRRAAVRGGVARSRAAGVAGPVRLSLRGRRVVAALIVLVLLPAVWTLTAPVVADALSARAGLYSGATAEVVVLPGDTLWGIARTAQPESDPRDTVLRIQKLNGLSGSEVSAGQRLVVPDAG